MSAAEPASASQMPAGITDPNYKPLPGRLGNLTVPQQHALETIKKELQESGDFVPERMDDAMLLRCVLVLLHYLSRVSPNVMFFANRRVPSSRYSTCCKNGHANSAQ